MEPIYYELLTHKKTINTDIHCLQLNRLNEILKEKRTYLVNRKNLILKGQNFKNDTDVTHVLLLFFNAKEQAFYKME